MPSEKQPMIQGLLVKPLRRFSDERGDFRELVRLNEGLDSIKQVSVSTVYPGVAKAWHLHKQQTEGMTVASGVARFAFADRREGSPTFGKVAEYLVDSVANPLFFIVPPGVAHGYRIADGPAVVVYITSHVYDPADQLNLPHDSPEIGYRWGAPEIK